MWRNASYKTYGYIKSTNIRIWKILGQIKLHKNPTQSVPKFKWSMHRLIFTEKYINMDWNLRHYTVTVHSKIGHLTTAVKVELHVSCVYVHQLSGSLSSCHWKVCVCFINMTVHVSFLNNSHHSITNNFKQLSSRNMWYGVANDQLTVTFSSWREFNIRPPTEFPTGYITNSFGWCSSASQIKHVAATWHCSTSLWLINQTVLELLPWEITENCCEGPHA